MLEAATLDAATAAILQAYGVPAASRMRTDPLSDGGGSCAEDF